MANWRQVRLGEVLRVRHGFAFPGSGFSEDVKFPTVLTPGNFSVGGGFRQASPKTFVGDYSREYVLLSGDLIVTMTDLSREGATLGLPATIPDDGTVYLHNQRIGLVEILDGRQVDKRFLSYFLRTAEYRAYILGTASGTTVRHTSPSRIENFQASLPSIETQHGIGSVLGALDDKIVQNCEIADLSLSVARLEYRRSVSRAGVTRMSSVVEPILGGTPSRSDPTLWDGSIAWAAARDITEAQHHVVMRTAEGISVDAASVSRLLPLPAGSVVITARGTVGHVARLGKVAAINQSCYGFLPGVVPASCLFFAVEDASAQAKLMAHGSVFDTITMRTFDHVDIPGLSVDEWASVESRLAPRMALIQQKVVESIRLEELRNALLPLLMSGKVRVLEAEKLVEEVV